MITALLEKGKNEVQNNCIFAGKRGDLLSGGPHFDPTSQRKKQAPVLSYMAPLIPLTLR